MKHRIQYLLFLIVLALTLSACAGTGSTEVNVDPALTAELPEPSPASDISYAQEPAATPSTKLTDAIAGFPGLSSEQTSAMSNWAEYGFGFIENDTYYGRFFLKDETFPMLISMELKSGRHDVGTGRWQILDSAHSPKYLIKHGDVLYYIMLDRTAGSSLGIESVYADGSNARELYSGECDYLSMAGDLLFFTDSNGYPVCMDAEGGSPRVLLERRVFYLYALSEDWIIFQDDSDGESLHLLRISDGTDIKLSDEAGFNPVIYGSSLFFAVRDPKIPDAFRMGCIDLSAYSEEYDETTNSFLPVFTVQYGGKPFGGEFYISGDTIRAMNGSEPVDINSWAELEDNAYTGFSRIMRFISDRWSVEEITGKDGGISAIMFHDRTGGFATKIPWLS